MAGPGENVEAEVAADFGPFVALIIVDSRHTSLGAAAIGSTAATASARASTYLAQSRLDRRTPADCRVD